LKTYGLTIWCVVYGTSLLVVEHLKRGEPVTRDSIWNIVLGVNFLIFALVFYVLERLTAYMKKFRYGHDRLSDGAAGGPPIESNRL
jgi:hypothetical protein